MKRRTRKRWLWGASAMAVLGTCLTCGGPELRLATLNVRNYPESATQERGLFELVDELELTALAVQEITEPRRLARRARRRLGASWRFVWPRHSPRQRVGVLFDSDMLALRSRQTHDDTRVYEGAKPAFEARFRSKAGGEPLRLVVVHLKAGAQYADVRRRQLRALRGLARRLAATGERTVVLGDFNTVTPADREAIAALADAADMRWVSRGLECTAYRENEASCDGVALDHVLSSVALDDAGVAGACRSEGCGPLDDCPAPYRRLSDHCPVTFAL